MENHLNIFTNCEWDRPVIRVGRISYMNVAPVYYGLDNGSRPDWIQLTSCPPSQLNMLLAKGELDISPVSSAAYAQYQNEWLLLPNLSISCDGEVMSVLLVSHYDFHELDGKSVILTDESTTAASLLYLLFALKSIHPKIRTGKIESLKDLETAAAALVIGDAALKEKWRTSFRYVWDLGELWKNFSELPFVFALWAVRKSFAEKYPDHVAAVIETFYHSKQNGMNHIHQIVKIASTKLGLPPETCQKYFLNLNYNLGLSQIEGLKIFFQELYRYHLIPTPVQLNFFQMVNRTYRTDRHIGLNKDKFIGLPTIPGQ